jgi:hypothetical protein
MKLIITTILLGLISCSLCDTDNHDEAIKCLSSLPKRELKSVPDKVYISLTTSPDRLSKLMPMLKTLDLEHIEKIFLALPEKYRDTQEYGEIPPELLNFPKLEIIAREEKDLGPIMKMYAAIDKVGKTDPNAIIISVDDDIGFPKGAINELIFHATLFPNAVVSGAGNYVETFGILSEEWPIHGKAKRAPFCGGAEISYCDTVEGWRGIAYRPRFVNLDRMKEVSQYSKACRTSDDLVISYVLAESRIEKIRVSNRFFPDIHRFEFGSGEGALHRIKLNIPGWSPRSSVDSLFSGTTNSERYQRCVLDIRSKIK